MDEIDKNTMMLENRILDLQQERAELIVHVELCQKVVRMVANGPEFISSRQRRGFKLLAERELKVSLDKHDALVKAEVLEDAVELVDTEIW